MSFVTKATTAVFVVDTTTTTTDVQFEILNLLFYSSHHARAVTKNVPVRTEVDYWNDNDPTVLICHKGQNNNENDVKIYLKIDQTNSVYGGRVSRLDMPLLATLQVVFFKLCLHSCHSFC
jgi:hypothetical protein